MWLSLMNSEIDARTRLIFHQPYQSYIDRNLEFASAHPTAGEYVMTSDANEEWQTLYKVEYSM